MAKAARVPWSREELVVACGLYFTLPFGQMHARNSTIVNIARLLGRTPSSVAMKLVNFASLDPEQRARGIRGLRSHSRADEQIWNEFILKWDEMTVLSEATLQALRSNDAGAVATATPPIQQENATTEVERVVMARTMQGFFRKAVLAAYDSRCCVTGMPVRDLLVASHILPWGEFPKHRLNPRNGLCLAAHFDRAFDRGLISVDENSCLILSPALKRCLPNDAIESEFVRREGQRLMYPQRFPPESDFLAYHRNEIFQRGKEGRHEERGSAVRS